VNFASDLGPVFGLACVIRRPLVSARRDGRLTAAGVGGDEENGLTRQSAALLNRTGRPFVGGFCTSGLPL